MRPRILSRSLSLFALVIIYEWNVPHIYSQCTYIITYKPVGVMVHGVAIIRTCTDFYIHYIHLRRYLNEELWWLELDENTKVKWNRHFRVGVISEQNCHAQGRDPQGGWKGNAIIVYCTWAEAETSRKPWQWRSAWLNSSLRNLVEVALWARCDGRIFSFWACTPQKFISSRPATRSATGSAHITSFLSRCYVNTW